MRKPMTVDGYKVGSSAIAEVIDKLTEADGSPLNDSRVAYLADAARLLALAMAEEVEEQVRGEDCKECGATDSCEHTGTEARP